MWDQQGKKCEDAGKSAEESCVKSTLGKTDSSLYDSGRTDSGFLSGSNLHSGTIVSEEIPTSSKLDVDSKSYSRLDSGLDEKTQSRSYSRLDSGVDVGLSDQLSELCIEESEDKSNPCLSRLDVQPESSKTTPESSRISWEHYFKQDEEGDTLLHIAIIHGLEDVVFNLVKLVPKSSYLDIRNDMRQTPLHLAVLTNQPVVVRRLVCAGADARQVDHEGNTPLHLAVIAGDMPSVKALTQPVTPTEVLAAQLSYPAPVIHPPQPDMYNYEGLTCVHIAVLGSQMTILQYLVNDLQANINARECKRGMSSLHMACEAGNESLASSLLELNASYRVANYAGDTPYGVSRANTEILSLLLAHGASPEVFSDSESDGDDDDFQEMPTFRDIHVNGVVNATA